LQRLKVHIVLFFVIIITSINHAQQFVNGNFTAGGSNWFVPGTSTETNPESTYGGTGSNSVAEVDNLVRLNQTVNGFVIGETYSLNFVASRRTRNPGPNPASVVVRITSATSTILSTTLTKTNTSFKMDAVTYDFIATATTLTFSITPGADIGTSTRGVIIDNLNISQPIVLSAELVGFEAEKNNEGVKVKWTTANEVKNEYFAVEKSRNGKQWQELTKVNGAGYSIKMTDYQVQDNKPYEGLSYYRLKQVDFDGVETYSDIVSVEFDYNDVFNVFPNPIHNYQELFLESTMLIKDIHVKIVDHKGVIVHNAIPIFGAISLKNIPSGSYLLNVYSGTEQLSTSKLIVN
jgi:hypothetical protein